MPSSEKNAEQQRVLLVPKGLISNRNKIPNDLDNEIYSDESELGFYLKRALSTGKKAVVLIDDELFCKVENKFQTEFSSAFRNLGIIILTKKGDHFLKSLSTVHSVLDILPAKEYLSNVAFFTRKAFQLLDGWGGAVEGRINQSILRTLNESFILLSQEKDPLKLLEAILLKAISLSDASFGCLYLVRESEGELTFSFRATFSGKIGLGPVDIKVSENSICGYVALTGKLMSISRVDELSIHTLPQHSRGVDFYDENIITTSLMTAPLQNSRGEIVAVLQLVNKRDPLGSSIPFDSEAQGIISSFATQAAICLENVDLYADIRKLFEGFVKASITAIESRDPSTGGHSERVAKMTVALARATTDCSVGIYRSVRFKEEEIRQLEYAALLHDFGKIGVREEVLMKAKKLYPFQLEIIRERINVFKTSARITYLEKLLKMNERGQREKVVEKEYFERLRELDQFWDVITMANEPSIQKEISLAALERFRIEKFQFPDGKSVALITEDEFRALSVSKGSLTESERLEVESHVRHTYQFLKIIPWTKDFRNLPEIAYCHHEKLDGSGYPRGLLSHEIPIQSKIMTIADIFDALTAADRWYKEAVPTERALDILAEEVAEGKLDPILFELFIENKVYELTYPKQPQKVSA